MITIVDYKVINLGSVLNMLSKLGVRDVKVAEKPEDLKGAHKIILPGVGSYDRGVSYLKQVGLFEGLQEAGQNGTPLLGICLGMQLLGNGSAEGNLAGLGLIKAFAHRLPGDEVKVPHMGWSKLKIKRSSPLLDGLSAESRFYFVHSYHVVCDDTGDIVATAKHGIDFSAVINHGNVWGAQFHPEKSHRFGMGLLKNFLGGL
jgi:glutamine amidotransferase